MALSMKKFGAAAAVSLATVFGASQASAMETGCRNADAVRADLRAESQFVLISARSSTEGFASKIFTSNAQGNLGYQVEEGLGSAAGQLCVSKYTNIRVNSNSDWSRPSWAQLPADTEYSRWLNVQEHEFNQKVVLGATAVVPRADGTEVLGSFMIVTVGDLPANLPQASIPLHNGGAIRLTDASGAVRSLGNLVNVNTQEPNYANFAGRPMQTAALSR